MAYVTQQAVLEEAGLWHRELAEVPAGSADGSNTTFTVSHKPLADANYSDTVTADDVTAYVNGTAVTVSAVNSTTGAITLAAAPGNGTEVTIDYAYTSISSTFVTQVIEEASEIIDNALSQVTTTPFTTDGEDATITKTVRLIARTMAAGLLLSREYGLQADEEASKAARAKIKQAEAWLATYNTTLSSNTDDEAVPRSSTERRIFQRYDTTESEWVPLIDEHITLNEVE